MKLHCCDDEKGCQAYDCDQEDCEDCSCNCTRCQNGVEAQCEVCLQQRDDCAFVRSKNIQSGSAWLCSKCCQDLSL